ncbi:transmembrane protein 59 [Microplitis demolitor]|uniref:transmembrane protein 59 n=1 Tax=Microplitis demolitor TaxID=69319 RepID=UPI0004CDCE78|nr:transmembrane protein 59 [Microplitis demolitor]
MFVTNLRDMTNNKSIIILLVIIGINLTVAAVINDVKLKKDPCVILCDKIPVSFFLATDKLISDSVEGTKKCCQRGCRFFNLADSQQGIDKNELNDTKDACESSCSEAYQNVNERFACIVGCTFMAKQRIFDLVSILSAALSTEDDLIAHHFLVTSIDMPDNTILSDPGLKKEILPGWWDTEGFKLPQTFIKSVPQDSAAMDYNISPDYSSEQDQSFPWPATNWLQCASKHTGIPRWILSCSIIIGVIAVIWIVIVSEKSADSKVNDNNNKSINDSNNDEHSRVILIYPNDKTPPDYAECVNEEKKLIT